MPLPCSISVLACVDLDFVPEGSSDSQGPRISVISFCISISRLQHTSFLGPSGSSGRSLPSYLSPCPFCGTFLLPSFPPKLWPWPWAPRVPWTLLLSPSTIVVTMPSSDSEVLEPGDGGHPSFLHVSLRGFLSHLCRPRRFGKHLFKPWFGPPSYTHSFHTRW